MSALLVRQCKTCRSYHPEVEDQAPPWCEQYPAKSLFCEPVKCDKYEAENG